MIFLVFLLALSVIGWLWCKRDRYPLPPVYPGALPLIGHGHHFIGDTTDLWKTLRKMCDYSLEKGGVTVVHGGLYNFYFVTDPDDCATIAATCFNKPFFYNFANSLFGNSLFILKENDWKHHRKIMNPAFKQQQVNGFNDIINSNAKLLVEHLEANIGKGPIDITQYLLDNVVKTTCDTTFGVNPENDNGRIRKYAKAMNNIINLFINQFQDLMLVVPFVYKWRKHVQEKNSLVKEIKNISHEFINKRKSYLNEAGPDESFEGKAVIDTLIHQGLYTVSQISNDSDFIVDASYETINQTLLFALKLIGSHPDVQDRIYKELQDVLGSSDTDIGQNDVHKLLYLDAVIKEVIRIYPSIPLVARDIENDIKLKNYTMMKNSICIMSFYGMLRHPVWGEDAEHFKPERWLKTNGVPCNVNDFAAFGLGKRNCIGKLYAMRVLKVFLGHILRKYCVTANSNEMAIKFEIILKPKAEHEISFELR